MRNFFFLLIAIALSALASSLITGCAQIAAPTGGAKDTIPPVVVRTNPDNRSIHFNGKTITLTMNEYIELQNPSENVLISPLPKKQPNINYNLKTVTVKLRDTLLPNTTYTIDFGNAIKDVHEGNVLKNLKFSFTTGSYLDSLKIKGKIVVAETGKPDSSIMAFLYRNLSDSAVLTQRPDYIARPDGQGVFEFVNLPDTPFRIYALKDGDGGKTYNSKSEFFAFTDSVIHPSLYDSAMVRLLAFQEEKPFEKSSEKSSHSKSEKDNKLKISYTLSSGKQDLLSPLILHFNKPVKPFNTADILLSDTGFNKISGYQCAIDSSLTSITISNNWQPETNYIVVFPKESIEDSTGNQLMKSDTIRFVTKRESDYGRVVLRFPTINLTTHPVIQFIQNDNVVSTYPLTEKQWSNNRFPPGEYSIRILYDKNENGIWDPGNYSLSLQPETVVPIDQKLSIRADWDNEREIRL